jgi:hypothetical protein
MAVPLDRRPARGDCRPEEWETRAKPSGGYTTATAPETAVETSSQTKRLTDAGIKELATLKNLTRLRIGGPFMTDAGLKDLAALKNLTALELDVDEVTDATRKNLSALTNLTSLEVTSIADVKNEDVKKLQWVLPKCKVTLKSLNFEALDPKRSGKE